MATIPRATYRLQLHQGFDFDAARALLPYLQRLGISHVYCSPITRARAGSLHGYDVIDHASINPELGGREGFDRFAAAARAHGLGLLLDLVPNHMAVFGADNAWWMDVLENGQASEFAGHFDIDWQPPNPALAGKVLVPVLGASYGDVLERGELRLVFEADAGVFAIRYHEHRFPIDPRSYASVLRAAGAAAGVAAVQQRTLDTLAEAFGQLPPRDSTEAMLCDVRRQAQRELQARLSRTAQHEGAVAAAIATALDHLNGSAGRDDFDALHDAQAFRLAWWRMAADEINYRRFFDINELAALRVEDERVFEVTHRLPLGLARAGLVDGFRIDHPDGLRDPPAYFERLQRGAAPQPGVADPPGEPGQPIYLIAEKILAAFEKVPTPWALHGTNGYRFATLVNGLFVERRNAQRMQRIWRSWTGMAGSYADLVYDCKRLVAGGALAAQLTTLANSMHRIALADRRTRDHGFHTLREALAGVAAAMPVYRTYVGGSTSTQDRRFIDWAIAQARRRSDLLEPGVFDFLRRCLLVETLPHDRPETVERMREFAKRFQQFCAPVAAKGVEDTAFYRYACLTSLNEVGGDPTLFGVSAAAFHGASKDRAAHWPHTMLATSTHDNKRAEDVRHRIDVLSEQPGAWRLALRHWRTATRGWVRDVDGAPAPSPADQVLLHQTLLGTLPADGLDAMSLGPYRERIDRYLLKAAREAKLHTSWTRPNEAYEQALHGFVRGLLGRVDDNPVLAELQARATNLAWFGAWNSLAVSVLKYSSPGVPDLYQGTELIDLSLVDPDNRRPVDYALRSRLLDEFATLPTGAGCEDAVATYARTPCDGRLKLWLIWRLLTCRREEATLFRDGSYEPLRVRGERRRHVIAFARRAPGATLVVIVARKFFGLHGRVGVVPVGPEVWGGTVVACPKGRTAGGVEGQELLAGRSVSLHGAPIELGSVLRTLPFAAILLRDGPDLSRPGG